MDDAKKKEIMQVEYPIVVYEEKIWTVYMHINKVNNKKYVGITSCSDIQRRRWRHGKGYGKTIIQSAINKYGWENFEHKILLVGLTKTMASIMEQVLIKYYHSHVSEHGYNWQFGGFKGSFGMPMRKEAKEKLSGENNYRSRKVVCLNTGKIYVSQTEAALDNNMKSGCQIGYACSGRIQFSGYDQDGNRLIWVYYDDFINMTEDDILKRLNKTILTTNSKQIICLTTGEIFDSIKLASKYCGSATSGIIRCCQTHTGSQSDHPRYHCGRHPITKELLAWMFLDDFEKLSNEEKEHLIRNKGSD